MPLRTCRTLPLSWIVLSLLIACLTTAGHAELRIHNLFSSNMVLQRNMPVPIWGWADPGQAVILTFAGQKQTAVANRDGKWMVTLSPLAANSKPQTMVVATTNDGDKETLTNILIGDVWLCAGQSNMLAMTASLEDAKQLIDSSANSQIRLFRVDARSAQAPEQHFLRGSLGAMLPIEKSTLDQTELKWQQASPASVPWFSGVAYVFGRHLHQKTNIPIGLIEAAFGGTSAEQWTPRDAMLANANLQKLVTGFKGYVTDPAYPGGLYNGSIAPLKPMAFAGLAWYQGESNSDTYEQAIQYRTLLPTLITSWRMAWGRNFPVLIVQIAAYHPALAFPGDSPLAWLREAQLKAAQTLPSSILVTAIDIGLADNWHPPTKSILGARLAQAAMDVTSGADLKAIGPQYQSMRTEGGKAVVSFQNVGGGLTVRKVDTNNGLYVVPEYKLSGFSISGSDHRFYWARATISGSNQVVLSSPEVPDPIAVRYGWAAFPLCNLYGKDGLPATPFRTDAFPPWLNGTNQ